MVPTSCGTNLGRSTNHRLATTAFRSDVVAQPSSLPRRTALTPVAWAVAISPPNAEQAPHTPNTVVRTFGSVYLTSPPASECKAEQVHADACGRGTYHWLNALIHCGNTNAYAPEADAEDAFAASSFAKNKTSYGYTVSINCAVEMQQRGQPQRARDWDSHLPGRPRKRTNTPTGSHTNEKSRTVASTRPMPSTSTLTTASGW